MSEPSAPEDIEVDLQWPHAGDGEDLSPQGAPERPKTPAEDEAPVESAAADAAENAPAAQSLTPVVVTRPARPDPILKELVRRMDALGRALDANQRDASLDDLGKRVDALGRTMQKTKAGDELVRLGTRVDALARSVEELAGGGLLQETMGRVDALAGAVETLCGHLRSNSDRIEAVLHEVRTRLGPLEDATAEVRRLNGAVTSRLLDRAERQSELHSQIAALAEEVRQLRRGLPVKRNGARDEVVDAIADAVKEALEPGAPRTAARSTAAKKTAAKKTAAKKTAVKKTASRGTRRPSAAKK